MFRSTTVAVEPANASGGPAGQKPSWADVHAKTWSLPAAGNESPLSSQRRHGYRCKSVGVLVSGRVFFMSV